MIGLEKQLRNRGVPRLGILAFVAILSLSANVAAAGPDLKSFSVADDIALTHFREPIEFSPDGRFFLVLTERGRLDLNRSESSIRVYRSDTVDRFILHSEHRSRAPVFWTITKSSFKNGPVISDVHWLADSSEIAFLAKTAGGNNQLFLGDVQAKVSRALTPANQNVTAFDVRSAQRFVYTVFSPAIRRYMTAMSEAVEVNGTGRSLSSLIFPVESVDTEESSFDLSELWAVVDGRRFRVLDPTSKRPIPIHLEGQRALALAPNGRSVVTALSVNSVPADWELRYKPASASFPYQVRAGHQNPYKFDGQHDVSEYVLIELRTGKVKPLTNAPLGNTAGWVGVSHADWSSDGQFIVLSDTFLSPEIVSTPVSRPCVVVIDTWRGHGTCVDYMKGGQTPDDDDEGWRVYDVSFADGEKNIVIIQYAAYGNVVYEQSANGSWSSETQIVASKNRRLEVRVEQDLNDPPVLVANDNLRRKSRLIWNPNSELEQVALGSVSIFKWKDKNGRDWSGGIYKPPGFIPGTRYPLVIQTHGFDEKSFLPSGIFPTAFAAQELAASGFVVLQVEECPIRDSPEEGPCQLAGYEAAIGKLSTLGFIDPDRVGIIGFSRTCYYVLDALTSSGLRFKAASITDGIDGGYLQYMTSADTGGEGLVHEYNAMLGASPFGKGLQNWFQRSPEFNIDKIEAPLQVVALGRPSLLFMWEPYAALRLLDKPVDLIVINTNEHVLSNPAARAISQGGTVDWFRFWIQSYEDPDPAKAAQYERWEALRLKQQAGKEE